MNQSRAISANPCKKETATWCSNFLGSQKELPSKPKASPAAPGIESKRGVGYRRKGPGNGKKKDTTTLGNEVWQGTQGVPTLPHRGKGRKRSGSRIKFEVRREKVSRKGDNREKRLAKKSWWTSN